MAVQGKQVLVKGFQWGLLQHMVNAVSAVELSEAFDFGHLSIVP